MEKIVRSVCQACHCECGVLVHVRDSKIIRIKGDPEHPMNRGFICVKGRAYPQVVHHPDRLKYPLRRAGERAGGKGRGYRGMRLWVTSLESLPKSGRNTAPNRLSQYMVMVQSPLSMLRAFLHMRLVVQTT